MKWRGICMLYSILSLPVSNEDGHLLLVYVMSLKKTNLISSKSPSYSPYEEAHFAE